ncbi:hypothetical protein [Trichlorobacter lovleyi]|uniref:hypothetical protein n=1 Tax=Trichlorobacter lovleyi TaxID=313985 RepID=UPI003D0CF3FB
MKRFLAAALLVAVTVSTASAWEFLGKDSYDNYNIKCNNGEKWRLVTRDGWWAAPQGSGTFMYKSMEEAAAKVCKE